MQLNSFWDAVSLEKLRHQYPRLWEKLIAFTGLNLILQLIPILASVLTEAGLGQQNAWRWGDALILVAFSWAAAPAFFDQFPWSKPRQKRYAVVAQFVGMALLFAVVIGRESARFVASLKAATGFVAGSDPLMQRVVFLERFATAYILPWMTVIAIGALYVFLITVHKSLLTKVGLRLRWHHQAQFAGFYVAKAKGLYEQAGLDVSINERDLERPLINIVGGREDEFGILMAPELVQCVNEGRDLVAVEILSATPAHELLVNTDSIKTRVVQGLPIRALSVNRYIEGAILQSLLAERGIKTTTLDVSHYSDNHGAEEFLKGQFDVIVVHRANEKLYLQRTISLKNWVSMEVINPEQHGLDLWGETLVTSASFARDRPEVVTAMRSATLSGWDLAMAEREFAAMTSFQYLKSSSNLSGVHESMINLSHQKTMLAEMIFMYTVGREMRGRQTEHVWRRVVESCRKAGLIAAESTVSPEKILGV